MLEFFYRTEDIKGEEVLDYFVNISKDREIVDKLKGRNPVLLVGSRGVGKSLLLKVAEAELLGEFHEKRILPVYMTFTKSSLIHTRDPEQYPHWMLAHVAARIVRALKTSGLITSITRPLSILSGDSQTELHANTTSIERIVDAFENSWQNPGQDVDVTALPTIENFKDAIEDICRTLSLARISLFVDEAAHILIAEQQRAFFTLYRDLRSPYLTCNAAVYPGVTVYGDSFQPTHDATMLYLDRDIGDTRYIDDMKEVVSKQIDNSRTLLDIEEHGNNFAVLALAANGNPRILLKTLARTERVRASEVNEVIREYYRNDIWSEHSMLAIKYTGHRAFVDWGRNFIESVVLPDLKAKNDRYLSEDKKSTCYFWIHRDAPQEVKEALRILSYTGIVVEHASGLSATRRQIGTRYAVNLGCLFSLENNPARDGLNIARNLTVKRMTEFGQDHGQYQDLLSSVPQFNETEMSGLLLEQLTKNIDVLDLTIWQKGQLRVIKLETIGDVLRATEVELRRIHYVGEKRSRRMKNAALAAVYEYLSG